MANQHLAKQSSCRSACRILLKGSFSFSTFPPNANRFSALITLLCGKCKPPLSRDLNKYIGNNWSYLKKNN